MTDCHRRHTPPNSTRKPRHCEPHPWLCAGVITLGVGAALATAAGTAHADDGTASADGSASSQHHWHATQPDTSSAGEGESSADPKTTVSSSTLSVKPRKTQAAPSRTGESTTSADGGSTDESSSTTVSGVAAVPSHESSVTHPVRDAAVPAKDEVHSAIDPKSQGLSEHGSLPGNQRGTGSSTPPEAATLHEVAESSATTTMTRHVAAASSQNLAVNTATVAEATPTVTAAAPAAPANPVRELLSGFFSVVNTLIAPDPAVRPTNPLQLVLFEVVRRIEIQFGLPVAGTTTVSTSHPAPTPVTSSGGPDPSDVVETPYGAIGKWLLQSNGQISNWGGQALGGKTLLEPINLIIIDPTSTTAQESTDKLTADMSLAGFPAQLAHIGGLEGTVAGETYSQQPTGVLEAFSDNFFLLPDDHARAFGPSPLPDGSGYVWTVAASSETVGFYGLLLTHLYASFDAGRDELADRLVLSGATLIGVVALGNAYNDATETTGDSDGNAVVVQLNN
jgi:hypothetical protein